MSADIITGEIRYPGSLKEFLFFTAKPRSVSRTKNLVLSSPLTNATGTDQIKDENYELTSSSPLFEY